MITNSVRLNIAAQLAGALKPNFDFNTREFKYDEWAKKLLKLADALIEEHEKESEDNTKRTL